MQRKTMIILLLAMVVGGCFVCACQSQTKSQRTPEVEKAQPLPRVVSASGKVVPIRWAALSFPLGGEVEELAVEVNDEVEEGEVLARLKATKLEQAVTQAEAALATAQARLAQVKAGARPQELEAAEQEVAAAKANLSVAQAGLEAAQAARDQAQAALKGARTGRDAAQAALKSAQAEVASAQAGVAAAKAELTLLKAGASERERAIAKLEIDQARNNLWGAQAQRDSIGGAVDRGEMRKADLDAAEAAVGNAHVAMQIAELRYEELEAGPRKEEVDRAQAQVDAAQAALKRAEAQVEAAQAQLQGAEAQVAVAQAQLAAAEAQVATAKAQVKGAEAQVAQAQARRDLLKAGARAEDVALAEAQVKEAQAALEAARAALSDAQLVAPFAGTVARLEVREGEVVAPGQPILYLGDLSELQVETTDLSEVDIAGVKVGQPVDITFDALPERKLTGRVKRIEPIATPSKGGTNYTVIISFDELDPDLRWGMTAFVDILLGD